VKRRRGRRGAWTLIVVPPEPGARTRHLSIGARALRNGALGVAAALGAAGLWSGITARTAALNGTQLAIAQHTILTLHDSVSLLRAAVRHSEALEDSTPPLILPVSGRITSGFQRARLHPLLQIFRPHRGIDLSAPAGTPLVAPADGTVSFVGWRFGDGLTVQIAHRGGMTTLLGHCRRALVKVGEVVHRGETVATVGESGLATGPHVHFEVQLNGTPIDPLRYIAAARDSATAVAERLRAEAH
jgi:murein DD-endopeptidase MepM/ murein hydrolase activator NlpD